MSTENSRGLDQEKTHTGKRIKYTVYGFNLHNAATELLKNKPCSIMKKFSS